MSFRNPSQYSINMMNSNQSNFNNAFANNQMENSEPVELMPNAARVG